MFRFYNVSQSRLFPVFLFVIAFILVMSRRPDAVLNPQFWAEDGAFWYSNAYNKGLIEPLLTPQTGYLQTISRLVAAISQFFPFALAPSIFNLAAIIIKILPVILLCSPRFDKLITDLRIRVLLAFLYLAVPNSFEVHANITNAHWHLALLACLIFFAEPSDKSLWRVFDVSFVSLASVSGPFSLLLLPVAAFYICQRPNRHRLLLLACLSIGAFLQALCILLTARQGRADTPLGASFFLFLKILGGQVVLGAIGGQHFYARFFYWHRGGFILVSLGLIAIVGWSYCLVKAPLELRLFTVFAALIFLAAIASPMASTAMPQWEALSLPAAGGRYWFLPMLAVIAVLVWLTSGSRKKLRIMTGVTLLLMSCGIYRDWTYVPLPDRDFQFHAQRFEAAASGETVIVPINPNGWEVILVKH